MLLTIVTIDGFKSSCHKDIVLRISDIGWSMPVLDGQRVSFDST